MGLILPQEVEVKWTKANVNHFKNRGYSFTYFSDRFMVNILDLQKGSNIQVDYICDYCGEIKRAQWTRLYRSLTVGNKKISCINCRSIKTGDTLRGNFSKSLYDWCIENSREDIFERWDYNLNESNPKNVSCVSHASYYLKCERNLHESELFELSNITTINKTRNTGICRKCLSFAQWGIDNIGDDFLDEYWDYENNKINPWDIGSASRLVVWIKCKKTDYHVSYQIKVYDFKKGMRCNYCRNTKVHPKDSFGQYLVDSFGEDAINKMWDYELNKVSPWKIPKSGTTKVWLKCLEVHYHGSYCNTTNKFYNRKYGCPYCSHSKIHKFDSIGYLNSNIVNIWSEKNKSDCYHYSQKSNKKVWWKCENNLHEDYERTISWSTTSNYRCPECVRERKESFLQEKVRKYLTNDLGYELNHEKNCTLVPINPKTQAMLPFDNELIDLKLLIEVNGQQHSEICGFHYLSAKHHNTTPQYEFHYQQVKDRYKRIVAVNSGYFYLAIDYTEDDENNTWKIKINNKIREIKQLVDRTKEGAK